MKLVIDTNVLMSCLIADSQTRKIIATSGFEFYVPDYVFSEITKHKDLIKGKTGLDENDLEELLENMFSFIHIIPAEEYQESYEEAKDIMREIDITDTPFLALALSIDGDGIWSQDKDFEKQDLVKVWKTKDIIKKLKQK